MTKTNFRSALVKTLALVMFCGAAGLASAAGGGGSYMQHADNDVGNVNSLQRGARNFFNYCAGCHSAKYVRYSRIAQDLGLPEDEVFENFMFGQGKVGDTVRAAMTPEHAEAWFGAVPPDLSLTGRSKGSDWIYSFLMTFYQDEGRELGVNNKVLEGAAMPHVLADLQGVQVPEYEMHDDGAGHEVKEFKGFRKIKEGSLSDDEYKEFVRDITNFLDYAAEPMQMERRSLGIKVLAYLVLLFVLAYAMKQEFWKDVH
ncbi:MAG: cytochrome c1 [Gammaproteobacteria bacterium]